jgi:hypothetical protein
MFYQSGMEKNSAGITSGLRYITQLPKEFDFEHPLLPPQFHYTGPFRDGKGRPNVDFPWDRMTGEPLIYVSMGTIMNGRADVFRTIAAGVAKHKETQLVHESFIHPSPCLARIGDTLVWRTVAETRNLSCCRQRKMLLLVQ